MINERLEGGEHEKDNFCSIVFSFTLFGFC